MRALAAILVGFALIAPEALGIPPRVAVMTTTSAESGQGRALVQVFDEGVRTAIGQPADASFRAVVPQGRAEVTQARTLSEEGGEIRTLLVVDRAPALLARRDEVRELAQDFSGALGPRHRVEVVSLGLDLEIHGETGDAAGIDALVEQALLSSPLNEARLRGLLRQVLRRTEAPLPLKAGGLRQIVVFTDTAEQAPSHDVGGLIELARRLGVVVHVVAWTPDGEGAARWLDEAQQLAERTGGVFLQPTWQSLDEVGVALRALADPSRAAWWLDLSFCGVPEELGPYFASTIAIEVWAGDTRQAVSAPFPFRQHAAGAAVVPCEGTMASEEPGAPLWVWGLSLLGGLATLGALALVWDAVQRRRQRRKGSPAPINPPPSFGPTREPTPIHPPPSGGAAATFDPDVHGASPDPDQDVDPVAAVFRAAAALDPTGPPGPRPAALRGAVLPTLDDPPPAPDAATAGRQRVRARLVRVRAPEGVPAHVRVVRCPFHIGARAADLVLDVPEVSGRHATLAWDGKVFTLRDEGSTNGTFLDGDRIPARTDVALRHGMEIGLSSKVVFRLELPGGAR